MTRLPGPVALILILLATPLARGQGSAAPVTTAVKTQTQRFARARTWVYQLQKLDPTQVAKRRWDLLVTDPSKDGGAEWWPRATVQRLRKTGVVLAYLSIGEAEDYRPYWQKRWSTRPPAWLGPENPEWKGNYKVRYWHPAWQAILLGKGGPVERILEAGYDGVYLDIVDAWEHWSERRELSAAVAQRRMVTLIKAIAVLGRKRQPGFLVVPQNAPEVATRTDLLPTISGLALEDTFFWDDKRRDAAETREVLRLAQRVRKVNKPVFAVDYCRSSANVRRFTTLARAQGFVPYATGRDLDVLTPPLQPRRARKRSR